MNDTEFLIDGRLVGGVNPPYIIAELSGNHNGSIQRLFSLIEQAKQSGADAVKIQTYTPDTITLDYDGNGFVLTEGVWAGRKLYDLLGEAATPWEWHEALFNKAREVGITMFSTPFDPTSIDFLEQFNPPAYKIGSFEIIDIPLIEKVASLGKPMIISTGMASMDEIQEAVTAASKGGCQNLVLLHCISGYPTCVEECNLKTIPELAKKFGVLIGLSDHSLEASVPVVATAMGAAVIEKHFTIRRSDGGPDASFSIEPDELRELVGNCKTAHSALGEVANSPAPSEEKYMKMRRSLYVVEDIKKGEDLTVKNVRSIRPGFGLKPKYYNSVLGKKAKMNIKRGTPLSSEHFD